MKKKIRRIIYIKICNTFLEQLKEDDKRKSMYKDNKDELKCYGSKKN